MIDRTRAFDALQEIVNHTQTNDYVDLLHREVLDFIAELEAERDKAQKIAYSVLDDPDYSPAFQDEYQRLWHREAEKVKALRGALNTISYLKLNERLDSIAAAHEWRRQAQLVARQALATKADHE
jgi:CHAD domain-containing protein